MTDDEARVVQESVESYLRGDKGRGFDLGNPQHFKQLVNHVRAELARAGFDGAAEDDLRVVTAMCLLGPGSATGKGLRGTDTFPPSALRDDLLGILRKFVPGESERLERVMEFAIAYGCGKWRNMQGGDGGWKQRWQGAMRGLVRALEPAVEQANRWLAKPVVGFLQGRNLPQNKDFPKDTAVWSDAWMLTMRLTVRSVSLKRRSHKP